MSTGDPTEMDPKKPTAGTLAGYHGVRERFWRHSKRYQVEIRDHVCKTKVHITIDRDDKSDEEQAREAALLRDAVARINYEETGKKKALNFPDEEPSREIMARARVELEKARVKAAEARAKPKAQPAVKPEVSAATLDEAQAAVALTTFSQPSHVVPSEHCIARISGQVSRGGDGDVTCWGCKRKRTANVRKSSAGAWKQAMAGMNAAPSHANENTAAGAAADPPMNPDAKLQAFLSGTGPQLPKQSTAPQTQPQLDPFAWQMQFAQMQAAQMQAVAQAAQLQGMYAGLISGSSRQAHSLPGQPAWAGGAVPWGGPTTLPWAAAQAQVAAAAQAAAAANPTATATLAQQAASWAAAQVAASLPGAAAGAARSVPNGNPAALLNAHQSLQATARTAASHPVRNAAVQGTREDATLQMPRQAPSVAQDSLRQHAVAPASPHQASRHHIQQETGFATPASLAPSPMTAPGFDERATLGDIADAAVAAAAAERSQSHRDADTTGTHSLQFPFPRAPAERDAPGSGQGQPSSIPHTSAAARPQTSCSPATAALISALTSDCGLANVEQAATVPPRAPGQVASDLPRDFRAPHAISQKPAGVVSSFAEAGKVGTKRSRVHGLFGDVCAEEDTSDERSATITIKETGSDVYSIIPGMVPSNYDAANEGWNPNKSQRPQERV